MAHGEFGKWLEDVEIDRTLAPHLMKVSEEFGDGYYATSHKMKLNLLYEIATLPKSKLTVRHGSSKSEEKKSEKMTVIKKENKGT